MFSAIVNFLKRHRRKFFFAGSLITGAALFRRYAEYKMIEWHTRETHMLLKKQKRKQHYEKSKQTAEAAVLSMAESLCKIVTEELDSDPILQSLHQNPPNKQALWEELKVLAFSRILCAIYTSSLAISVIHVKLLALSGSTYSAAANSQQVDIDQQKFQVFYMSSIQEFMENGIPLLIRQIYKTVASSISRLSLTQSVNIEQLEVLFHDITLEMAGEFLESDRKPNFKSTLRPWSKYCFEPICDRSQEAKCAKELLAETRDVLNSDDFSAVVDGLIQQGLDHCLNCILECYPPASPINNNSEDQIADQSDNSVNFLPPQIFVKASLPIVKLVPILIRLVHNSLSVAPGQLLHSLLLNSRLEAFSNNVYSAFCIENESS